jgi:hypothetical protein
LLLFSQYYDVKGIYILIFSANEYELNSTIDDQILFINLFELKNKNSKKNEIDILTKISPIYLIYDASVYININDFKLNNHSSLLNENIIYEKKKL